MTTQPDVETEKGKCLQFLDKFEDNEAGRDSRRKYFTILQSISNRVCLSLDIELDDISEYYMETDPGFAKSVESNGRRYAKLFAAAADELMPPPSIEDIEFDTMDEFLEQAKEREEERINSQRESLGLAGVSATTVSQGIVTQATDVKPLIQVATYIEEQTGFHHYQEVAGRTFLPLKMVPTHEDEPKSKAKLQLEVMNSKFVKFQEIKLQERADEVPQGETPRVLKILISGPLTRGAKPGDQVVVSGLYIPEPYVGFKAIKAGLITNTFLEATRLELDKISYSDTAVSEADVQMIQDLSVEGNIYGRLAKSIAPEIFGHEDVKKALLLMMVSGVNVEKTDGMKLRGDIHMCLMGDPGVAKSQLLKFIANMSPRAVYTTGKGSSGVGLTAAVVRDPTTKEVFLEGGALVIADNGICCIDEFDKMDESDRTAIHEVMEQQTVSIAKAGITTTLNARTTVLAAANPAWGKYNTKKSPAENIALPAALLSRFDLLWLILDRPEDEMDRALSEHVLAVRRSGGQAGRAYHDGFVPLTPHQLRTYISFARQCNPVLPESLTDYIASVYAELRQENKDPDKAHTYTTPRTLMSILRLGQALAKLQFRDELVQEDLEEALRLMKMSKISLIDDDRHHTFQDPISAIYRKMNDYWRRSEDAKTHGIPFTKIRELCMGITAHKGATQSDLIRECIEEYSELGILTEQVDANGNRSIFFLEQ